MRKLLLAALLLTPHLSAQSFDVASVHQSAPDTTGNNGSWSYPAIGGFRARELSLYWLIQLAYNVDGVQIANKPDWLDTVFFDIDARPEEGIKLTREELRPRLQNMLKERFHLKAHTETRPTHGFTLAVSKSGARLTPTTSKHFAGWTTNRTPGNMVGENWTMPQFAQYLSRAATLPVIDGTGITGSYDISFAFDPKPDTSDGTLPPLNTALEKATGLTLKEGKVPVETIVIDSVDKVPTEN